VFSGGGAAGLRIEDGVVLGTGKVMEGIGPNLYPDTWTIHFTAGDPDIETLAGGAATWDAAALEFDLRPQGAQLRLDFLFASEEYTEWIGSPYPDTLGVFLDGRNLAWAPGTQSPVSADTVNGTVNAEYFVNNDIWDDFLRVPVPYDIEYDGFTTRLTIVAAVTPGQTHHLKLVIADVGDDTYDSALFLGGLSTLQEYRLTVARDAIS